MTVLTAAPSPKLQFFVPGTMTPLAGGLLFTYAAGTSAKQATYSNADNDTPNTNPIVLDANGECVCFLDDSLQYAFTLSPANDTDPPTNPYWTVDQIGYQTLTAAFAPINSPAFTGTPTAPTAAAGTNSTQLATTAFVETALGGFNTSGFAPINSPVFTGTPQAPTPATSDNSTDIATTAYVVAKIAASLPNLPTGGITQTSTTLQVGKFLIQTGSSSAAASGGHTTTANVTFGTAYATCLYANVAVNSSSFATAGYLVATAITSLASTGFTVAMDTNSSDGSNGNITGSVPFTWIAVGIVS